MNSSSLKVPSFASQVNVKEGPAYWRQENLYRASDAWVADHLVAKNPEESPFFKGLGRWAAWNDMVGLEPEWSSFAISEQVTGLWDYEGSWASSTHHLGWKKEPTPSGPIQRSVMTLRMFDAYLGDGIVDRTVRECLAEPDKSPRSVEEFYARLQSRSGGKLPDWKAARPWFEVPGHPIVQSSVVEKNGKSVLRLSQKGFSVYPDDPIEEQQGVTWAIPMTIKFKDEEGIKEFKTILDRPEQTLDLPAKGKVSWAYPNGGGMGLFRTRCFHRSENEPPNAKKMIHF